MRRRLALAGLGLLLGACASVPPERPARFWSGRLGLQVHSEPPQSLQAGFELQGDALKGELTLLSPVGSVLARLSWRPGQATLERGEERWIRRSVEELGQQLVNTALPVQALFDWIEGRPLAHAGWVADLSGHGQGRILARRTHPEPAALLRIVLDR